MSADGRIVLVIDDDSAIRDNIAEILESDGYVCWLAATCDSALQRLELEVRGPDVVLLDLWLPGMSAEHFVSLLRERAEWANARIILTTAAMESSIPNELQVDAVLLKPFGISRLLDLLGDAAHNNEKRERAGQHDHPR